MLDEKRVSRIDEKRVSRKTGWWLVVGIIVLSVLWCASGVRADAQSGPTPTPTATPVVVPSPLPTTRPLIVPCPPWRSCAWLPIGAKS
jgi:hypothetical protein